MTHDGDIPARVKSLEDWRHSSEMDHALWKKDKEHIDGRFDRTETRLDKIDAHLSRLVWLIISTLLGGFLVFVIKGGLQNVG